MNATGELGESTMAGRIGNGSRYTCTRRTGQTRRVARERKLKMARYAIGEDVKVKMPRGKNKRGVMGISVMYTTSPEAKFDGAIGTIVDINPHGPYEIPLYLVDFKGHENRVAIPWLAQWFREEWIVSAERKDKKVQVADRTAAAGFAQTTTGETPR